MDSRLAIDIGVLLFYFIVIIFIGLRMGRKEDNLEDFALGGRRIPWWAVLASIVAAETSAATFFGTPGEGFALRNYTYLQLAIGTILARILVSYIFIKPYYDYKVYSIYEYLTVRFGVPTKNAASAIFLFTRVLASGARLYVAAIALVLAYEMITGARPNPTQTLWIYVSACVVIVVLTAIYTTLGGIKAVVWTDVIQASIMMGSALVALGLLYFAIPGGWNEIVQRHGGFGLGDFIDTGLDPARTGWDKWKHMFEIEYTIFAGFIGSTFVTMATHGTDQDMVQRMLTAPDIRRSRRSLMLSGLADIPIVLTFLSIGLLLWTYYQAHPDPTLPKSPNEIFCHFVLYEMPVGMRGLLIAGIFATAMGSLSTALNALATSFTRDWYQTYINRDAGQKESLRAVRSATVVFSVLMIVVASLTSYIVVIHPNVRIIPIVLGIFGYTYGPLLGVFLCGMFTRRRGDNMGNIIAMIAGFIAVAVLSGLPNQLARLVLGIGDASQQPLYSQPSWLPIMEFPWWICFGTIVTFSIAVLFRTSRGHQPPGATPSSLPAT
ncbi:MAG TPA: sodium:solute symporter [Chthoniobacterales bacterium]|jgi:SSS family transporter|nr:sodium:solute symporter [Chthoniobacterales bacterium]